MEENKMRKKLKSIIMIFASILLCGSNMLSTITIKANVTNLEDTGSVSYTHLDVYKRQVQCDRRADE